MPKYLLHDATILVDSSFNASRQHHKRAIISLFYVVKVTFGSQQTISAIL